MNYLFLVQGEGRGHLTQALTLYHLLRKNGHTVSHVIVGKSERRILPPFFLEKIECPVTQLESPNFVTDKEGKSVNVFETLTVNLRKFRTFRNNVDAIDDIVQQSQPDAIINFYDFLGGLYFLLKAPKVRHIAIAHQFLLNHSSFHFPKGRFYDKRSLLYGNKLAGFRADKILALSFDRLPDEPRKNITVVPPLLREKVKQLEPTNGEHFLAYMVNHGYAKEVEAFHREHPEVPVHCFWDKKGEADVCKVDETLTFHQLNEEKFLSLMASSKGYLSTAGFESICEAMYLGKPVLMVPVAGHYEQTCNAADGVRAGAGVTSKQFDLNILLDYLPKHTDRRTEFRAWCGEAEDAFLRELS